MAKFKVGARVFAAPRTAAQMHLAGSRGTIVGRGDIYYKERYWIVNWDDFGIVREGLEPEAVLRLIPPTPTVDEWASEQVKKWTKPEPQIAAPQDDRPLIQKIGDMFT